MEKCLKLKLQPVSSVEEGSARRLSEKMKNFQADKIHVLPVPLHVRLCRARFNRPLQNNNVNWSTE